MSRDGGRVAFATWIDGKNVVVEDGRPGEPFDAVAWPLALSDDGRVVAYAARLGSDQFCVAAGRRSARYRSVAFPIVSGDGRTVAFAASDGSRWFAVRNGREEAPFDWVGHLSLDAAGGSLAYVAESRGKEHVAFVVRDGRRGASFDRVTRPVFSKDGSRIAYGGRRQGRWHLVVNDHETPVQDEIASAFLSDDGRRAGYVVEGAGRAWVVGPEGGGPEGGGPEYDWVGWPAFAPDGKLVHFAARENEKILVAGDATVSLGDWVVWDPVLSPDGHHIGFGARIGRTLCWKGIALPTSGGARSTLGKGDQP